MIVEEDDIYGEHVNLAARLQTFAASGGICVSRAVYEVTRSKLPLRFVDLGRRTAKNIPHSFHVFALIPKKTGARAPTAPAIRARYFVRRLFNTTFGTLARRVISIGILAVAVAVGVFEAHWLQFTPLAIEAEPPSSLPPTDKPSIVVLPFSNIGGDRSQDYFAEGISEDIITDLSQLSQLFVIARSSSSYYKATFKVPSQIGTELSVKYVLTGSVRKEGDRVRVNCQLVDSATGGELWAERYDRELNGIFDIQDDISARIVSALATKLDVKPVAERGQRPADVQAYDVYLKGYSYLHKSTPEDTAEAVTLFKSAIAIDPNFSRAHAALAAAYLLATRSLWHKYLGLQSEYDSEALAIKEVDLAMRDPSALAFTVRAAINYREGLYDKSFKDLANAEALEPNDPEVFAQLGRLYVKIGQPDAAILDFRTAWSLDPNQPTHEALLGVAEFARNHFKESARLIEAAYERNTEDATYLDHLIAAYALEGRVDRARAWLSTMIDLRAKAGVEPYTLYVASKSQFYDKDCDLFRLREGLQLAGVPAGPDPEPPIKGANCVLTPAG